MGFGFTAKARRSLRDAKEDGERFFSPPRGKRGQGLKSWDDGNFLGFFAGFAPGGFLDEAKRGGRGRGWGDWRLEIGDWRLEIGDWRLEI
jgi:hypothetical protein